MRRLSPLSSLHGLTVQSSGRKTNAWRACPWTIGSSPMVTIFFVISPVRRLTGQQGSMARTTTARVEGARLWPTQNCKARHTLVGRLYRRNFTPPGALRLMTLIPLPLLGPPAVAHDLLRCSMLRFRSAGADRAVAGQVPGRRSGQGQGREPAIQPASLRR